MRTRSPFPGMDPWLEAHWGDIHHRIVLYACDQIESRLPEGLFAAVEETVTIADVPGERIHLRPDVAAFESPSDQHTVARAAPAESDVAIAEPLRIHILPQPIIEGHIEIRQLGGAGALVTAIEVISRTNKLDRREREAYESKRKAYYAAGVNVVEIDLLRAGATLLDFSMEYLKDEELTPYTACAYRAPRAGKNWVAEYYPLPFRNRLPAIRIPLRPTDPDVVLDLQAPIDEAYRKGRYGSRIDYSKPPRPALSPEDAAWAAEMVKKAEAQR